MTQPDRDFRIDTLRGIAAIAVLLLHAHHAWYLAVGSDARLDTRLRLLDHWLGVLSIPITFGNLGVNLFFVLSGLCIHGWYLKAQDRGEDFSYRTYVVRRFWRLYPAYLAAVILSLLCLAIAERIRLDVLGAQSLSAHATQVVEQTLRYLTFTHTLSVSTFGGYNPPLYTMAIEVHFYLLYPLVIWTFRRMGALPTLVASAVLSGTLTAIVFLVGDPSLSRIALDSALLRWPEWIMGCVLAERMMGRPNVGPSVWPAGRAIGAAALLLLIAFYLQVHRQIVLNVLWTAGIALLIPFYLEGRGRRDNAAERGLARIGMFSYSLYLVHWPILRIAALLITPTPATLGVNALLYLPILLGILLIAFLFFRWFERPFLRRPAPGAQRLSVA